MRELSSAPEGHLFRTPDSPAAERRGNQEFAAQLARSPSAQRRENRVRERRAFPRPLDAVVLTFGFSPLAFGFVDAACRSSRHSSHRPGPVQPPAGKNQPRRYSFLKTPYEGLQFGEWHSAD